jgi:hypothetical protein
LSKPIRYLPPGSRGSTRYPGIRRSLRALADRRDATRQMSLFTADTHFVVYINTKDLTASQELHSREALAPVFAEMPPVSAPSNGEPLPEAGSKPSSLLQAL